MPVELTMHYILREPPVPGRLRYRDILFSLTSAEVTAIAEKELAYRRRMRNEEALASQEGGQDAKKVRNGAAGRREWCEGLDKDEVALLNDLAKSPSYVVRTLTAQFTKDVGEAAEFLRDRAFAVRKAILENTDMLGALLEEDRHHYAIWDALADDMGLQAVARSQLPKLNASAAPVLAGMLCNIERERMAAASRRAQMHLLISKEQADGSADLENGDSIDLTLWAPEALAMGVRLIFESFAQNQPGRILWGWKKMVKPDSPDCVTNLCEFFLFASDPAIRAEAAKWVSSDAGWIWDWYAWDQEASVQRNLRSLRIWYSSAERLKNDPERLIARMDRIVETWFDHGAEFFFDGPRSGGAPRGDAEDRRKAQAIA